MSTMSYSEERSSCLYTALGRMRLNKGMWSVSVGLLLHIACMSGIHKQWWNILHCFDCRPHMFHANTNRHRLYGAE